MPRASWKGFLRLSLVSCPVYLSPATTHAKSVRLHQVWVPSPAAASVERSSADEEEEQPLARAGNVNARSEPVEPAEVDEPEYPGPATRIALRPHDPHTGAAIERDEVRKGYEGTTAGSSSRSRRRS